MQRLTQQLLSELTQEKNIGFNPFSFSKKFERFFNYIKKVVIKRDKIISIFQKTYIIKNVKICNISNNVVIIFGYREVIGGNRV